MTFFLGKNFNPVYPCHCACSAPFLQSLPENVIMKMSDLMEEVQIKFLKSEALCNHHSLFKQNPADRFPVHTDGIVCKQNICYFQLSLHPLTRRCWGRITSSFHICWPLSLFLSHLLVLLLTVFSCWFLKRFIYIYLSFMFHRHTTMKVITSFDKGPQETPFTSLAKARWSCMLSAWDEAFREEKI